MPYLFLIAAIAGFALWTSLAGGALLSYVTRNPSRGSRVVAVLWAAVVADVIMYMESLQWSSQGWPIVFLVGLVLLVGLVGPAAHVLEKQRRTRRRSSKAPDQTEPPLVP